MSIQLIQQAICYMEEHICENINYTEVAKSVHMSNYNFHRAFSFIVGMTANEYIRKRRLTLAAKELQTTNISVIDATYKYGYESPESFSKAFSRFHGSTPKQAKQKGAKLHLFNHLVIKIILEGGSIMDYRIEHKERKKFIALVKSFPNEIINDDNDHGIPDFWTECYEKNLIEPMKSLRPKGHRDLYGLCSSVKNSETHFNYGIGIIIEMKYAENGTLDAGCREAMQQIRNRHYEERLVKNGMKTVHCYGIACYKKRCRVVSESVTVE